MPKPVLPPKPHSARRMQDIQPFHVMELLARARQLEAEGRSIVHMEIGEPDFATPAPVLAAAAQAMARGEVHYTPALGLPALREAVAGYYRDRYGVAVDPRRVVITPGASGALLLTLGVLVNPGEQVLMADPGYPCNRNFVRFLEGRARSVPVGPEIGYQLTPDLVARHWTDDIAAVLLASPANPTGTVVPQEDVRRIAAWCAERGAALIVDEIYHGLIYDGEDVTALGISDQLFVLNSFSKYFSMTGWRVGWLVAPSTYVEDVDKLAQNIFLAAPTIAQHAALAAFTPSTIAVLEARRREFRQRRDYLLPALRELGFSIKVIPQGAFYLYAGCERFTDDSFRFAHDLLEQAGVAVTPGRDFGVHDAQHHLRFAYTTSLENLQEGVARLRRYLGA